MKMYQSKKFKIIACGKSKSVKVYVPKKYKLSNQNKVDIKNLESTLLSIRRSYNLTDQFEEIASECIDRFEKVTGLRPKSIHIEESDKWLGRCNRDGQIFINKTLVENAISEDHLKNTIYHELCHLKFWNHEEEFTQLFKMFSNNIHNVKFENCLSHNMQKKVDTEWPLC